MSIKEDHTIKEFKVFIYKIVIKLNTFNKFNIFYKIKYIL